MDHPISPERTFFNKSNKRLIKMILNLKDKIGEGIFRECFLHPENFDKIIKVVKKGMETDQNQIEFLVFTSIKNKAIHSRTNCLLS